MILPPLPAWLPNLLMGIFVFSLFYLSAHLIKRFILRIAKRGNSSKSYIFNWLGVAAKNALIVLGLIIAAASMGINVSALVASLGFTGVTVGLVMKESLANTLAGTLVLIHPPFQLGDLIKIYAFEGKVSAITMRYTYLVNQKEKVLVPNIVFFTQPFVIVEANAQT